MLQMQRTAKARGVRRCILCAPCAISREARSQAESGEIAVSFLPREELTALLGQSNPVSDAQPVALGQRRKKKNPMILNRQRARHYAAYGALLLGLYTLSGLDVLRRAEADLCGPGQRLPLYPVAGGFPAARIKNGLRFVVWMERLCIPAFS